MDIFDQTDMMNPLNPISPVTMITDDGQDAGDQYHAEPWLFDHTPGIGEKTFAAFAYMLIIGFLIGIVALLFWL